MVLVSHTGAANLGRGGSITNAVQQHLSISLGALIRSRTRRALGQHWTYQAAFRSVTSNDVGGSLLWQLADGFEADLHPLEIKVNELGVRGLYTLEPCRGTLPMVSIPLTSCLVIPAPPSHVNDMPEQLHSIVTGSALGLNDVQGWEYMALAAWILKLARLPIDNTSAPFALPSSSCHNGDDSHPGVDMFSTTWHTYIHHVLPKLDQLPCLLTLSIPPKPFQNEWFKERTWAESMHRHWLGPDGKLWLARNLDDSLWALALARSRAISMPLPLSRHSVELMVPLIDMVNHAPSHARARQHVKSASRVLLQEQARQRWANCKVVWSHDAQRVLLVPLRELCQGEELLIDYGARTPEESMSDYGFVVD